MVKGGYYIKARKIQESEIAHKPPHFREIWDWLCQKASHKSIKLYGKTINRGQCLCTYKDIQEGLHWKIGWRKNTYSKWDCERALKWLRAATMIATKRTTIGLLITLVNYDIYQNPANYESDNTALPTVATRRPQRCHTIIQEYKNGRIKKKNKGKYNKEFEEFWEKFPGRTDKKLKGSKHLAAAEWKKLNKVDKAAAVAVLPMVLLAGTEYLQDACRWLKQRRWDDFEPEKAQQQQLEADKTKQKEKLRRVEEEAGSYLRGKNDQALKDLLKDRSVEPIGWLIRKILEERKTKPFVPKQTRRPKFAPELKEIPKKLSQSEIDERKEKFRKQILATNSKK